MVDRIDHNGQRQTPLPEVAPTPLPPVSVELVEHLEQAFRRAPPQMARSMDAALSISHHQSREFGQWEVIDLLKRIIELNIAQRSHGG